jgi:hypothetical protein
LLPGGLRDVVVADKAAASQLADATQKEESPIGAEIAITQGTIKAWQSFAHKQDEQAFQQVSAAADMQDRSDEQWSAYAATRNHLRPQLRSPFRQPRSRILVPFNNYSRLVPTSPDG